MKWGSRAALLDDDDLILRTWALAARGRGVALRTFAEPGAFLAALATLPRDTDLFVDARLAEGVKGEEVAAKAAGLGFPRVFLATGLPREAFGELPWLSGMVGKDPPW